MKLGMASAAQGTGGGVDYRLERQRVLFAFRAGQMTLAEVCDAQAELLRNAEHCGIASPEPCPICEASAVTQVTYVFGARLPSGGRCMTSAAEMQRLARRAASYTAYVVEVCVACRWNHLVRSYGLTPR
jgi:Family of unknown function (DUF5318)